MPLTRYRVILPLLCCLVVCLIGIANDPNGPASAILLGRYKLIRYYAIEGAGSRRLFDLETDIREQHDLAQMKPETVQMLEKRLTTYLTYAVADLPKPNPNYDPKGPSSLDRRPPPR